MSEKHEGSKKHVGLHRPAFRNYGEGDKIFLIGPVSISHGDTRLTLSGPALRRDTRFLIEDDIIGTV